MKGKTPPPYCLTLVLYQNLEECVYTKLTRWPRAQVLWEGNRWKPVSMADIIQPSKVKMAYRKAMLQVHPDKCGSLGPEARLIAKRVFEAVNEGYTVFAEKENP